jgi:hypothetical protein
VESLLEFVDQVLKHEKHTLYRGERLAERKLLTKIGQVKNKMGEKLTPKDEAMILRAFQKRTSLQMIKEPSSPTDWLMLARHHGLPTRLIDFTTNPLVALFFAVEKEMPSKDKDKNSIVYGLLNSTTTKQEKINDPFTIESNLVINPYYLNERMFSQQSRFLIIANPLNEIEEAQMLRIEIPDSFRKKIKGDLNRFGINKMNLFRDLDSIASFIKWSHTDKY